MLINSLEKMESIVASNKSLSWDGWTVVHYSKSSKGATSKDGILINKSWHLQSRYEPDRDGWHIPDRLIKNNE